MLLDAAILLAFCYFVGHSLFTEAFMLAVALSVAAIPEGLSAVLTITLALSVHAKHRFMAMWNHDHEGHAFVFVTGAPERTISMCSEQ